MFDSDESMRLLASLTSSCSSSGHADCGDPTACEVLAESVQLELEAIQAASIFDIGAHRVSGGEPSANWSTIELLFVVTKELLSVPWRADALKRSVWITEALARLSERGIPADATIRSHLGLQLRRAIARQVAVAWAYRDRTGATDGMPWQAQDILDEFEAAGGARDAGRPRSFLEVLTAASTGDFRDRVENWIASAAVADIAGWKIKDPLVVDVPVERLSAKGGRSATRWIFDRFSKTYYDEWDDESVAWELCFALSPEATAIRVGLERKWLSGRPASVVMAARALKNAHTQMPGRSSHLAGPLTEQDIIEDILDLVDKGELSSAQQLARDAHVQRPGMPSFRRLLAFTLIPSSPRSAFELLNNVNDWTHQPWLRTANIACCRLVERRLDDVAELLDELQRITPPTSQVWLWVPRELISARAKIRVYTLAEWLDDTRELLRNPIRGIVS